MRICTAALLLLTRRENAAYPQVGRLVPTLRGSGSRDLFYMAETIRQELLSPRPQRALEGRSEPQAAEQRLHPRRLLRSSTVRCSDASGGVGRRVPNVPGAKQLISPCFRFVLLLFKQGKQLLLKTADTQNYCERTNSSKS